jgi:hypothetical protein
MPRVQRRTATTEKGNAMSQWDKIQRLELELRLKDAEIERLKGVRDQYRGTIAALWDETDQCPHPSHHNTVEDLEATRQDRLDLLTAAGIEPAGQPDAHQP